MSSAQASAAYASCGSCSDPLRLARKIRCTSASIRAGLDLGADLRGEPELARDHAVGVGPRSEGAQVLLAARPLERILDFRLRVLARVAQRRKAVVGRVEEARFGLGILRRGVGDQPRLLRRELPRPHLLIGFRKRAQLARGLHMLARLSGADAEFAGDERLRTAIAVRRVRGGFIDP
jgi:hypothetical protein